MWRTKDNILLRYKVALILALVFTLYETANYIIHRTFFLSRIIQFERQEARKDMKRVLEALNCETVHLDILCQEWAISDTTYNFVKNPSESYICSHFALDVLSRYEINALIICDNSGKIIKSAVYDFGSQSEINLPEFGESLPLCHPLMCHNAGEPNSRMSISGIYDTGNGPFLMASRPILKSGCWGPIQGYLIMGRNLNAQNISRLIRQTRVNFEILRLNQENTSDVMRGQLKKLSPGEFLFDDKKDDILTVYTARKDLNDPESRLVIKAEIPRYLSLEGRMTLRQAFFASLMAGMVIIVASLLILQKYVITPMIGVTQHIRAIRQSDDLSERIHSRRSDEIGLLSCEFDRMMEKLEYRTKVLIETNRLYEKEISTRMRTEEALKEKEAYLRTILETIQTGILITDPRTRLIKDVNPAAAELIGEPAEKLIGRNSYEYLHCDDSKQCPMPGFWHEKIIDGHLHSSAGKKVYIRMSSAPVQINNRTYFLLGLSDITDIKTLLKIQEINIGLAKSILQLTNGVPPRYMDCNKDLTLFFESILIPCNAEGGDHFLVWTPPRGTSSKNARTAISLKDQSGHQVGCILRSIITDLMHNSILQSDRHHALESRMIMLNNEICHSGLFMDDHFFTSINIEIDHETMKLKYVSAGHPPFLVIRGEKVMSLPGTDQEGANIPMGILPDVSFTSGEFRLMDGDRLILYTDGLIEMPLRRQNKVISVTELKDLIRQLIHKKPDMPASDLMKCLLTDISQQSRETVIPAGNRHPHANTSADDVTLICIEIENKNRYTEQILKPANMDELCDSINTLYIQLAEQWRERDFKELSRLRLVIEESLLNAWKHGNREVSHKPITVRWRFGNDFHLKVIDEGEGFNPDQVTDPTFKENREKEFGRGIFIIRHFGDIVNWTDGGKQLHVIFKKQFDAEQHKRHDAQPHHLMGLWNKSALFG